MRRWRLRISHVVVAFLSTCFEICDVSENGFENDYWSEPMRTSPETPIRMHHFENRPDLTVA